MKGWLLIIAVILLGVGSFCRGCFVSEDVAVRALEKMGFTDIEVTHHAWFAVSLRGCSKSDAAKFTARATNPAGKEVTIEVCSGWILKGATIRSD